MKLKVKYNLLSFALGAESVYLIIHWFGWRLLVVLVLFVWMNNLQLKADEL